MRKALPVILSAALLGISRLPWHCGWMGFIALLPLLWYFDGGRKSWKTLLRDAFLFSAVNLVIWLHWIWGVTSGGFVGIILLYTIYYYLTFVAIQLIGQKLPRYRYAGFILVFLSLEYLQNFSEFRFAWTNLGYALSDYTVLIQAADLGGVVLLSLFMLLVNVWLYKVWQKQRRYLIFIAILLVVWAGYGIWCLKTIPLSKADAQIAVMQPSIPQEEKWETQHFTELYDRYRKLTRQAAQEGARLVIWPEAAMPAYVLRDEKYLSLVQAIADSNKVDLFTGFPDVLPAPSGYPGGAYYYNAASLFRPYDRWDDPYYKMILVPVGERIPLLKIFPFMWKLQFGQANWEYGPAPRYFRSDNETFSPQICFEIAFPELNRKMAFRNLGNHTEAAHNNQVHDINEGPVLNCFNIPDGPDKIDFLVNITNDAWFGRSAGPWIHAMMTKFRAVENRIQIYRSANTGISMAVDPMGRIITRTKLFEITNLKAPLYKTDRIPLYYYLYAWPRIICVLTALLILAALFRRKPSTLSQGGKA